MKMGALAGIRKAWWCMCTCVWAGGISECHPGDRCESWIKPTPGEPLAASPLRFLH